jgi:hypothetical protein
VGGGGGRYFGVGGGGRYFGVGGGGRCFGVGGVGGGGVVLPLVSFP